MMPLTMANTGEARRLYGKSAGKRRQDSFWKIWGLLPAEQ